MLTFHDARRGPDIAVLFAHRPHTAAANVLTWDEELGATSVISAVRAWLLVATVSLMSGGGCGASDDESRSTAAPEGGVAPGIGGEAVGCREDQD